jgi:hypothetical protein
LNKAFNKLDDYNKISLQEIVWMKNKNIDWKFWKLTYKSILKYLQDNNLWIEYLNIDKLLKTWEHNKKRKETLKETSNNWEIIKTWIITWYYSPVPWQKEYAQWSINADIKMQWRWVKTASWKKPEIWMVAVPKGIDFWKTIILPQNVANIIWHNSCEFKAEDRWWNIKWNRIDIYCWVWDEWRKLAQEIWRMRVSYKIV